VPREEGLRHEIRLPKGHIEPGESADTAALREVREESGYHDLEIITPLGDNLVEYDHRGEHVTRKEHYFLMRLGHEHAERPQVDSNSEEALFTVRWARDFLEAVQLLTYNGEKLFAHRAGERWNQLTHRGARP
jgi:8-oxo-dGTP pyrophosphatase MutT (NUDIX family)